MFKFAFSGRSPVWDEWREESSLWDCSCTGDPVAFLWWDMFEIWNTRSLGARWVMTSSWQPLDPRNDDVRNIKKNQEIQKNSQKNLTNFTKKSKQNHPEIPRNITEKSQKNTAKSKIFHQEIQNLLPRNPKNFTEKSKKKSWQNPKNFNKSNKLHPDFHKLYILKVSSSLSILVCAFVFKIWRDGTLDLVALMLTTTNSG